MPVWNPDFPATTQLVRSERQRLLASPTQVHRPIVVLNGYRTLHWQAQQLAGRLARLTHTPPDRVLAISYPWASSFEGLDELVVRRVEARWPSEDPAHTVEVDVVGISMGGLVARLAATEDEDRKRLRVRNLYTLGSPHRGAIAARRIAVDRAARDMIPGSDFLKRLDSELHDADYALHCYAKLQDHIVGARQSAPHGQEPMWVSGNLLVSHFMISRDPRVVLDLALRLRAEQPIAIRGSRPPAD